MESMNPVSFIRCKASIHGVWPALFWRDVSASNTKRARTMLTPELATAAWRAVFPFASLLLTSAPELSRARTQSNLS